MQEKPKKFEAGVVYLVFSLPQHLSSRGNREKILWNLLQDILRSFVS